MSVFPHWLISCFPLNLKILCLHSFFQKVLFCVGVGGMYIISLETLKAKMKYKSPPKFLLDIILPNVVSYFANSSSNLVGENP